MSNEKAISPMIATVLLIAFTVAVGGILSVWLTTLSGTATTTTGSAIEKATLCANSVISVKEVVGTFNSSGIGGDVFNVTVQYLYGSENLYYFNLTFVSNTYDSKTVQPLAAKNFAKTSAFKPGQLYVFSLNITSNSDVASAYDLAGSSMNRVTVSAMCQDTYPVQSECKAGQACMKV